MDGFKDAAVLLLNAEMPERGALLRTKSPANSRSDAPRSFHPNKIVANDRFRELAEECGFKHLVFKPALFAGTPAENPRALWRVTSDLVLPRMSERCVFVSANTGEPFTGDFSKGGMHLINEDPFTPSGFRYRGAALGAVGPFDVAVTWESFAAHPTAYRILVVSQRFRQFCREAKISANWFPIHVDD